MGTKMINLRIDDQTQEELKHFLKKGKNITLTEVVRNALKEYLSNRVISWEDIDHRLIPFFESFLKGFEILGVIKPTVPLSKILDESIPIILSVRKGKTRIDFGIILEADGDDVFVRVKIYWSNKQEIRNDDSETFFVLNRDLDNLNLRKNVGEFFRKVYQG